jgi:DNA-directed RNA polymerase subunit RPC12/RpoP
LSTHKSITRNRFIKVFELEALVDIDDWLLGLPKELGVFLNVKGDVIKFEQKASDKAKLKLAEHFDDWIIDLMNGLTKIDESAVDREIRRIPSILGGGYHNFFKMDIKKEKRKFLILHLTGENHFTTKSDYGDRTYTTFTVNKDVKESVLDFQPDIIEKAKKSVIQSEIYQRNGNRYYYVSPAGRNISRLIRTSEKDFQISLKNLLIDVVPVENFSYSILAPSQKHNIVRVSSPRKMCVKCGKIFTPLTWDRWEIKYLSTNKVYVCEECNPNLKKIIVEEKVSRSLYHLNKKKIESKKSKIRIFSIVNLILFLVAGLLLTAGLLLLSYIIIGILEVYLLIIWKLTSNKIKNMRTEESLRKKVVFDSVKQYDGNLLKKKFIPEFCKQCRWIDKNDQKCHVDEEAGEIYDDFNLNGENECFKPREIENIERII